LKAKLDSIISSFVSQGELAISVIKGEFLVAAKAAKT
jgi:hypothetical protein